MNSISRIVFKENELTPYREWEGSVNEAAEVLDRLLSGKDRNEDNPDVTPRIIRHYTQLGILDRPERRGKEAFYKYRQLLQFLYAKKLAEAGWPLKLIKNGTVIKNEALQASLPLGVDEIGTFEISGTEPPDQRDSHSEFRPTSSVSYTIELEPGIQVIVEKKKLDELPDEAIGRIERLTGKMIRDLKQNTGNQD